jgi:hypothetical protein
MLAAVLRSAEARSKATVPNQHAEQPESVRNPARLARWKPSRRHIDDDGEFGEFPGWNEPPIGRCARTSPSATRPPAVRSPIIIQTATRRRSGNQP